MQAKRRTEKRDLATGAGPPHTGHTSRSPDGREDEAEETRSGRPMAEEDAADRVAHHESGYGGENGEPRKPKPPDSAARPKK